MSQVISLLVALAPALVASAQLLREVRRLRRRRAER